MGEEENSYIPEYTMDVCSQKDEKRMQGYTKHQELKDLSLFYYCYDLIVTKKKLSLLHPLFSSTLWDLWFCLRVECEHQLWMMIQAATCLCAVYVCVCACAWVCVGMCGEKAAGAGGEEIRVVLSKEELKRKLRWEWSEKLWMWELRMSPSMAEFSQPSCDNMWHSLFVFLIWVDVALPFSADFFQYFSLAGLALTPQMCQSEPAK